MNFFVIKFLKILSGGAEHAMVCVCVWMSEDNVEASIPPFRLYVGFQLPGLHGKCLPPELYLRPSGKMLILKHKRDGVRENKSSAVLPPERPP